MNTQPKFSNRLALEKSPYLLQHAHNPVDWFPWGQEAFDKARREDKPILVSIGYSTCHWCHVMEKESYEDLEIGALMNEHLVNIKVDREERPDVDKIYITAVSAMTGSAGWPLNVFLTPDLQPFYGGTYFPPKPRWGQPAWRDVVNHISHAWKNSEERSKLVTSGQQMTEALKHYMASAPAQELEGDAVWLDQACTTLAASFDASRGGFSAAPKFPMPVYHNFLLRYFARTKNQQALDMVLVTLREMAKGGIYDHLAGGFARYSTDADWHVPHFEKMLYDNAQLVGNFVEVYQITKENEWRCLAEETLGYIQREMTHPEGGFYSAEDADSLPFVDSHEKTEGAFYVWDKRELVPALTAQEADLFCFRYGVRENGNAKHDPHGEFTNKNILYAAHPLAEAARQFQLSLDEATAVLESAKRKLTAIRQRRPHPHLDDKVLSAWNGLMISGFAKAAQVFDRLDYRAQAQKAATFLKNNLYDASTKTLYRSWREGQRSVPGIADDYAFLVQSLLDLYETDFDVTWIAWAEELMDEMLTRFYDQHHGGFFMTAADQDPNLLLRVKEDSDNVEPSASSIAVLNLLRLYYLTDREDFKAAAQRTLQATGHTLRDQPRAMPQMLVALDFALHEPDQFVVAGTRNENQTQALLRVIYESYRPAKILLLVDGRKNQEWLSRRLAHLKTLNVVEGEAAVYHCKNHTCQAPISDPMKLASVL